ncbi:MAG: S46 family peptidase [Chitinophagaceae bacterium]
MYKHLKKILLSGFLFIATLVHAGDGMWLPQLLAQLNEKEMKSMGMKISAADIYNINKGSLKDAIVSFGGFCTGEIISSKGLILTNHHCGFSSIQNHSTIDHNYIRDGFWSRNEAEEMPNKGLFVTFIVRIEDVSKAVLSGVTSSMSEKERQSTIDKNIAAVRKNTKQEDYQKNFVRAFFNGNQYFLFVTETYNDIRLVGAPPSSIGNFGKDTDNWNWPRHTGDFSMFRIYAGKDNKPADYSPDNVPYTPKKYLSISLDGVAKNDFTMVFGFPGRTNEYLYSEAVRQIVEINDPVRIQIRDKALAVIDAFMRKDEKIKIQYASKFAGISNAWKKWQGEVLGLTKTKAVAKKQAYEAEFQKRVDNNPTWKKAYGSLLNELAAAYEQFGPVSRSRDVFLEVYSKIELFAIVAQINNLIKAEGQQNFDATLEKVKEKLQDIYKDYNAEVDEKLFATLMEFYYEDQKDQGLPKELTDFVISKDQNFAAIAAHIYKTTTLDQEDVTLNALNDDPNGFLEKFKNDNLFDLYKALINNYVANIAPAYNTADDRIQELQRTYMKAQMEVFKEKKFYPDANSTMRVTYGKVNGYEPKDAVWYEISTHLSGVMEKYKPGDYEFDVPEKLRELYKNKDYGPYGENGKMPVCFIGTNHTTGGNSGSPALDAYGNLIGLNFDRAWEGTMSDINYDPSICRNIMVDIRYVLFLVDKFAGATRLIDEMKLVHPKKH